MPFYHVPGFSVVALLVSTAIGDLQESSQRSTLGPGCTGSGSDHPLMPSAADLNGDGRISDAEALHHFALFDLDGDQKLSLDEYTMGADSDSAPTGVCLAPPLAQPGPDDKQ
jgi:hypothetical protein